MVYSKWKVTQKIENALLLYSILISCIGNLKAGPLLSTGVLPTIGNGLTSSLSLEVFDLYKKLTKLTPNIFAVTEEDSCEFENPFLTIEKIREIKSPVCVRSTSSETKQKIKDIAEIFKKKKICTSSSIDATDLTNGKILKRKRRSDSDSKVHRYHGQHLEPGHRYHNDDGSITDVRECVERGSRSSNKNLRLVRQCAVTTTLPDDRFPRYINEVICDSAHYECISGEGSGHQNRIFFTFKRDRNPKLGADRLDEWEDYGQEIRTSCDCQMLPNSDFKEFV